MEMTSKRETHTHISISTSFCSRFTLIGVNLGRCDRGKPEVYANLLWSDVTEWIKALSEPFRESSICNRATTVPSEISINNTKKNSSKFDKNIRKTSIYKGFRGGLFYHLSLRNTLYVLMKRWCTIWCHKLKI